MNCAKCGCQVEPEDLRHMELFRATPSPGGGKVFLGFKDSDPIWN